LNKKLKDIDLNLEEKLTLKKDIKKLKDKEEKI